MIELHAEDGIATVTMNRPERSNALDLAALDALADAWQTLASDEQVRVVILTGAGERAFSGGADLKAFASEDERRAAGPVHPAFFPERVLLKPVIAAVNGACIAGGCELLLATDIRLAVPHARFALPEASLGLFPAGGSAVRAPRRLPWPAAMHLLLSGEQVDATTALRMGLIGEIVEPAALMDRANEVARNIVAASPAAVEAIKACALETDGLPLGDALDAVAGYSTKVHAEYDSTFHKRR